MTWQKPTWGVGPNTFSCWLGGRAAYRG